MIHDLLHPKNLVFRADVKERNSPIYQKYFVYLYICPVNREWSCTKNQIKKN